MLVGRTLGHYRVVNRLGGGGMGEVYRAEDLTLGRTIALKVLPVEVAADPDRLARFEREARAVAALTHPHIVTLHSIEEADGVRFLTMELVEGETLERWIAAGGLSLGEVLRHGAALASALEVAHRHGIVHRDLKPANVIVGSDGEAKILDFGLAKALQAAGDEGDSGGATLTETGSVLGTVPYMAPEQLQGLPADPRSDLFSLGVVLYEMATGRHPFRRSASAETLSAILRDDPLAVERLRPELPAGFGRIVRRLLAKEPSRRYQTAADLALDLEEVEREATSRPTASRKGLVVAAGAAAVFVAVVALLLSRLPRREQALQSQASTRSSPSAVPRTLSQLTFGAGVEEWSDWSPDGARLVVTAEIDGFRQLLLRDTASGEEHPLTSGHRDSIQPTFTHDGDSVLFVRSKLQDGTVKPTDVLGYYRSGGDVWSVDLATGAEEMLLEDAFDPDSAPDGRLAVGAAWAGPPRIWLTDGRGHNPRQLTTDASEAVVHATPRWSPDGRWIAFRRIEQTKADIALVEVQTQAITRLTDDGFFDLDPTWTPDGRALVFSSYRSGGLNLWQLPLGREGSPVGPAEQLTNGAGPDVRPAVAPDGRRITFSVLPQNADLWRLPVDPLGGEARGDPEPVVATSREDSRGAWSPDGTVLAFNSDRGGDMNLWLQELAGGAPRQLTRSAGGDYQPNWSPDGTSLTFFSARAGNADIWSVRVADGSLAQLTEDPALEINPFYSPDGHRIAFMSDRDGRLEVWLMAADGGEQRRLTSVGVAGHFLRWLSDEALVFRSDVAQESRIHRLDLASGEITALPPIQSGGHMSLSPDRALVLDVAGHKILRVFHLDGSAPRPVFEFEDPAVRIDYPVWSPDGRWVVFDRVAPQGGDIWLLELG